MILLFLYSYFFPAHRDLPPFPFTGSPSSRTDYSVSVSIRLSGEKSSVGYRGGFTPPFGEVNSPLHHRTETLAGAKSG